MNNIIYLNNLIKVLEKYKELILKGYISLDKANVTLCHRTWKEVPNEPEWGMEQEYFINKFNTTF